MSRILRVMVFVDEANLMGAIKTFNRRLDWIKLRDYLANVDTGRELVEMVIYVGLPPAMPDWKEQRDKKQNFLYWLKTNGFMVVTKDGSPTEGTHYKANVDVLMAIDAIEFSVETKPDVVVLVTGDSDFAHLAHNLRRRGIRVEIASVQQNLSSVLKAAASGVIDLVPLFNKFETFDKRQVDARIGGADVFDDTPSQRNRW